MYVIGVAAVCVYIIDSAVVLVPSLNNCNTKEKETDQEEMNDE
jgi:hypothetical protein